MTNAKSKTATLVALFLMFAIAISLVAIPIPTANAQTRRVTIYPYINAIPNPVRVGDEVLLHFGITIYTAWPQSGWRRLTITVTKPDNTTQSLGPFDTDTTGGTGYVYVPTMEGTYYFQVHFPEQVLEVATLGIPANSTLLAASSEKLTLTVQKEPLKYYPGVPLPTEYWSRPIDAQNREWASISGNWLHPKGYFIDMNAPYNDQAPNAPHILWAKPLVGGAFSPLGGGLAGGLLPGPQGFECGDAYEGLWTPPVIIGGALFFNRYKADGSTRVEQDVVAVDLRTGEELWVRNWNNTRLSHGQTFYWDLFNYHAVFAYLWTVVGTTWTAYEPYTGRWVATFTGVPVASGTPANIYGKNGEIIRHTVSLTAGWMTKWNSTHVVTQTRRAAIPGANQAHGSWFREYMGTTFNASLGIMWNVTIPRGLPGSVVAQLSDRLIGTNFASGTMAPDTLVLWAISTAPGREGQLLFNKTWPRPSPDIRMRLETASVEDGVFTVVSLETAQHYAFDINTGAPIWTGEKQDFKDAWSFSSGYFYDFIYKGKLFSGGCGGTVNVYNVTTGKRLWTYDFVDHYGEFTFDNNWFVYYAFVADEKLYINYAEHSPNDPKERGAYMVALDVETGKEIWTLNYYGTVWGGKMVIGDNIIAMLNSYQQHIYAIGKGPSATTVSIQNDVTTHGNKVLVKGTVIDISAGTKQHEQAARFPSGVPAVSDASMGAWMEYVYMQKPRPTDVTGVEVVISVVDPNGNSYEVGRTTSDASGGFKLMFTPEVPGEYTVIAAFAGSESYWPSYAHTYLGVEDAPQPTPAPTPTPAPMTDTYILGSTAGIIIAIVVVGLLLVLLLRKRP